MFGPGARQHGQMTTAFLLQYANCGRVRATLSFRGSFGLASLFLRWQEPSPICLQFIFDAQTRVFRIDAADMSYVLGINENKQVQTCTGVSGSVPRTSSRHRTPIRAYRRSTPRSTRRGWTSWHGVVDFTWSPI